MTYLEVSAQEGTNVNKVMDTVLSQVEKNQMWQPERRQTISLMSTKYDGSQFGSSARFKLKKGKSKKDTIETHKGDTLNKFGWG